MNKHQPCRFQAGDCEFYVNYKGQIRKCLPRKVYQRGVDFFCTIIIIGIIIKIVKSRVTHPVTIIANTIYGHVAHHGLSHFGVSGIVCRDQSFSRNYFAVDDYRYVMLEGTLKIDDCNSKLIPLNSEDISRLESHTGLSDLNLIQKFIIQKYKRGIFNLDDYSHTEHKIISIEPYILGFYLIKSTHGSWLSQMVITDQVEPLAEDDIVINLITEKTELSDVNGSQVCVDNGTLLKYVPGYKFFNGTLRTLNSEESETHTLMIPRRFSSDIKTIHPFHLPSAWNLYLNIMTVVGGLVISQNKNKNKNNLL